jgi:aspartate/methionine/tyrosine aminotransferase
LQAAVPQILEKTKAEFHLKNLNMMREAADIFYDVCKEIPCLTCPHKPEGAMAAMVSDNDFKLRLQLVVNLYIVVSCIQMRPQLQL